MQRAQYTFAASSLMWRDKTLSDVVFFVKVVLGQQCKKHSLLLFLAEDILNSFTSITFYLFYKLPS